MQQNDGLADGSGKGCRTGRAGTSFRSSLMPTAPGTFGSRKCLARLARLALLALLAALAPASLVVSLLPPPSPPWLSLPFLLSLPSLSPSQQS